MVVRRQDRVALLAGLLDASVALSAVFFNHDDHRLLVLISLLEGFHIFAYNKIQRDRMRF